MGIKVVWTCHNLTSHEGQFPRLQDWVTKRILSVCHVVLAHGPACVEAALHLYGEKHREKMRSVPHANYIDDYPNATSREEARNRFQLAEHEMVFLFLGAIRGYKGLQELLTDFATLDNNSARLIIAGKPRNESIEQQIQKLVDADPRVIFHSGFVPDGEIQHYMAAADVTVLPYRKILTSGTLLLAASFGKVAIVPDAPTLLDTIAEEGVIPFKREEDSSLIEAMNTAIAERGPRGEHDNLAARGRISRDHVAKWGWREMAAATIEAYEA